MQAIAKCYCIQKVLSKRCLRAQMGKRLSYFKISDQYCFFSGYAVAMSTKLVILRIFFLITNREIKSERYTV